MGSKGLLPFNVYVQKILQHFKGDQISAFFKHPTLLVFVPSEQLDVALFAIETIGLVLAIVVLISGAANMLIMSGLWMLYLSVVNVGQIWYSFGWESQLLECGFLSIFLCPLFTRKPWPLQTPPPKSILWAYRWLLFRIMIGAGLIKLRGDKCWKDLTCMNYHYQTQPVPNPLSYYFHQLPEYYHMFEVGANHFVELIAPLALLIPIRAVRIAGGWIQIIFQLALIASGNLSFLNYLTILPAFACFDDKHLSSCISTQKLNSLKIHLGRVVMYSEKQNWQEIFRNVFNWFVLIAILGLSIPVVHNLYSPDQAMNTSFEPFRIVNTYGAFGSITKERRELIIEGTVSDEPELPSTVWLQYEFKCKPGNVTKMPCLIAPYHYRLDWLMWFAAMQRPEYNSWIYSLIGHLLHNDPTTSGLLEKNPFLKDDGYDPLYIRVMSYKYTYTSWNSSEADNGEWWKREDGQIYIQPMSKKSIRKIFNDFQWYWPKPAELKE